MHFEHFVMIVASHSLINTLLQRGVLQGSATRNRFNGFYALLKTAGGHLAVWRLTVCVLLSLPYFAPAATAEPPGRVQISTAGNLITLDSGTLLLQLDLAPDGAVLVRSLKWKKSGHEWALPGAPGGMNLTSEQIATRGLPSGAGFQHLGHSARSVAHGGRELRINLEHTGSKLLASLSITAYPNSPVVDLYVRLKNNGPAPLRNLSCFDPLSLALVGREKPYRASWVTRNIYGLHHADVRGSFRVDGGNWNGPNAAGWLAIQDLEDSAVLVVGIEWERHWAFDLRSEEKGKAAPMRLSGGLAKACSQDLAPGETVESPHLFLGVAAGDLDDAANLTHDYLQTCVLPPDLSGFPYVCYDIWSTEQDDVERRILDEARFAAKELGVEVFYHDASWYRDSDITNKERWGVGLGSYTEDRRKLPSGLRHMSDVVHGLGMKFGLWVCPEMVDVMITERERIPDLWMTTANGQFNVQTIGGWNPMKMLCLGNPQAETHLQQKLLGIIHDFKLDWLKWDASGLPGLDVLCNRADHGHQAGNGSQAAVLGKYRILDTIHKKYPGLILEQCSYGTRLDYGMARHGSRVNWLSDSTAPSSHVRDNVMAAAYVLPSACNMTWIMRDEEVIKPQTPAFLDTMFRSRMMGSFGFGTLHGSLDERVSLYSPRVIEAAIRNVKNYKEYRHLLSEHVYHLTPAVQTNGWQGMEFIRRDGQEAVVFLFRNGSDQATQPIKLRALEAMKRYDLVYLNTGSGKTLLGSEMMKHGLEVTLDRDPQESEILRLRAR